MGEVVRLPMAAWLHGASEGRQGLSRRKTSISLALRQHWIPGVPGKPLPHRFWEMPETRSSGVGRFWNPIPKSKISIFPSLHIQQPDAALPHLSRSVPATTQ